MIEYTKIDHIWITMMEVMNIVGCDLENPKILICFCIIVDAKINPTFLSYPLDDLDVIFGLGFTLEVITQKKLS